MLAPILSWLWLAPLLMLAFTALLSTLLSLLLLLVGLFPCPSLSLSVPSLLALLSGLVLQSLSVPDRSAPVRALS